MEISIRIGDAVLQKPEIDNEKYPLELAHIECEVREIEIDDAPYGKNSGGSSYTWFDGFARRVGLYPFFFERGRGLVSDHPAIVAIFPRHLLEVQGALEEYRSKHPDAATEGGWPRDHTLAFLVWFEWWMRWALENCARPAMQNW